VIEYVKTHWPREITEELKPFHVRKMELSVIKDCLAWGGRVVVPKAGRQQVLELLHQGHPGIVRMNAIARSYVWWPLINEEIEGVVKSCEICKEI